MPNRQNLMVGTSPTGQGGIASVIRGYISYGLFDKFGIQFIATHQSDKLTKTGMIWVYARAVLKLLWLGITRNLGWVHVHLASKGSYMRKRWIFALAHKLGGKTLVHLHGGGFVDFYQSQSFENKEKIVQTFKDVDKILVLSMQMANWIADITGQQSNLEVLYNTVPNFEGDLSQRQTQRILFLGNLSQPKGVFDLVRVFAKLVDTFPNAQLRLGGTGDVEGMNKLISELGVEKNITLLGWVAGEQKQQELAQADIFCLPSYHEQMPMSLLEAMSAKMAVVATQVGGVPDIIQHQKNGLLLEPGDETALYDSLSQLLSNETNKLELSEAGKRHFDQYFCEQVIMSQLKNTYQALESDYEPSR